MIFFFSNAGYFPLAFWSRQIKKFDVLKCNLNLFVSGVIGKLHLMDVATSQPLCRP